MEVFDIFLDVDGTLCNDQGIVPKSARKAVKTAQEKGHRVYLCTGRCKAELFDHILEIGFDGIIGSGGGYIEVDGDVLYHKTFCDTQLTQLLEYFKKNRIGYYAECNHGMYVDEIYAGWLENFITTSNENGKEVAGIEEFKEALHPINTTTQLTNVNKLSILCNGTPFKQINDDLGNEFTVHYNTVPMLNEEAGEISLKGISKSSAIAYIQANEEKPRRTMAIGDSSNDIDMLQHVDISIAMGNAGDHIKEVAMYTTKTHDEGGIEHAFIKYEIL